MYSEKEAGWCLACELFSGLKLFGERYSGLEYDYRGLVHVFTQLKRNDRAAHYTRLLQHWSGELHHHHPAGTPVALSCVTTPCITDFNKTKKFNIRKIAGTYNQRHLLTEPIMQGCSTKNFR